MNILTLSIPLYTIQMFDRVLPSGSGATLIVLTVAVLGGIGVSSALEEIRARLLVALGVQFDAQLSTQLFDRLVERDGGALLRNQGLGRSRSRYGASCADGQRDHSL